MKFRKKGIKPVPSGINSFLKKCPLCNEEIRAITDDFHAETYCPICGVVISDITGTQYFLHIFDKKV
mgnify:FL=1